MLFFHRLKYNPLSDKRPFSKKGVAVLMAMTSLILMVYLASEVTKDTALEYVVNSQEVNRIKAYYSARNSLDVALLRIKIYQQVAGLQLPPGLTQQLDQLWQFPFMWPLPITGMSTSDSESSEEKSKAALFDGEYDHTISDEGSKIDINDLASPSKVLQEITSKQLLNIFEQQKEANEDFRDQYQNYNFTELINRIADWMTDAPDNLSKNGGDKRNSFRELGEDYPPNRGFRTIDELRLIPGMNDELFRLLSPQITIYGMKAINPNIANEKVIKSLDVGMTDEAVKAVIERREDPDKGGPFRGEGDACRNEFKSFVESYGSRMSEEFDKIPFNCTKVINFRIEAHGKSSGGKGAVRKKITAVVMDIKQTAAAIKSAVDKENTQGAGVAPGSKPSTPTKEPLPKGRPRIVYWSEI